MPIKQDAQAERIKLVKAVFGSKLGKKIADDTLIPILLQIEEDAEYILEDTAIYVRMLIVEYLMSITPAGRTYKILHYDPEGPRGHKTTLIGEYTASAEGQPPAQLTGTYAESMDYEIAKDGSSFRIGLLKTWGEPSDTGGEFESVAFSHGNILVNPDLEKSTKTPVGTYGTALTSGFTSHISGKTVARPWFTNFMISIRPEIRKTIRSAMKETLRKATRKISVRRAIVFKVYFQSD